MDNTIIASSSVELIAALASATAGTTILLASGNYGDLNLNSATQPWAQFASEVTIRSADPDSPVTFTSVQLNGVKNLTFDGVKFDYVATAGAVSSAHPFYVIASENITIKNSVFDGDLAQGVSSILDGYGTGYGVNVTNSSNITIENNDFYNWARAGVFNGVANLVVKDNDVHDIRSDGFDFADVDHVLIEGNYIHDFRMAAGSGDHPDMIQFWTTGTTSPSTDIVIRENFLDSGAGSLTQSIFIRNQLVDQGKAGLEMYYQNITIENNVIYNSHTHGITVGETIGLTIQNNTILQNPDSAPDGSSVWIPTINVNDASQDVLIANNILPSKYNPLLASSTSERTVTGNLFVQSSDPLAPNYVGDHFVNPFAGATATLDDLKAVQGGIIDQMNVGSSLTQPDGDLAPVIISDGGSTTATISVLENSLAVTTVKATDPDSNNLTYSVTGGADANLFTINATTGALAFLNAPDYELPTDVGADNTYQVTVQASDGLLTGTQSLSVNVTNVSPETLTGDGGDNTFLGSADREAFSGLSGVDTVSYASATAAVTASLTNPGTNTGFATGDTYSSIENLTGSTFNDKLTGDANANVLDGGAGNDTLNGGAGVDSLIGGLGNDTFVMDNGTDTVSDTGGTDTITSTITRSLASYATIENLTLLGSSAINGTGNGLNNTITGNSAANVLDGGAGNDTLNGGAGVDSLIGGLGNDTFVMDNGTDTVSDTGGTDTITSTITRSLASYATIENLTLLGSSAINGTGNGLNNTITGNSGANVLDGGTGSDTLIGGLGKDTLTGGAANDTFVFKTLQDSSIAAPDLIGDFAVGDKIKLSAIDADTGLAGDQAFHIGGGGGHAGDLVASYSSATNLTTVNLYVNNDATIDSVILMTGDHHNLALGDLFA